MLKHKLKILLSTVPWDSLFGANSPYVPTGISFVAGVAERANYDVKVINPDSIMLSNYNPHEKYGNCDFYEKNLNDSEYVIWKELENFLKKNHFDVLGISVKITQFPAALKFANLAKKINPKIIIICGGIGVTVRPDLAFTKGSCVDYVVRGEGEITFLTLLTHIEEGKTVKDIPGISYRNGDNVIHNKDASLISDLDSLPHPAKHLYTPIDNSILPPIAYGRLFTSRGCPFACSYCDSKKLWTRKVRYNSPEYVVEEMEELKRRFGVKLFVFDDDTFALDKKQCDSLLDLMIERNLGVYWRCETRANLVNDKLLEKMKRAGCMSISIGVESGNDMILKKVKKGITKEQLLNACNLIKKHGMLVNAFFMFGFPWESESEIKDTIDFLYKIAPNGEVGAVHSYLVPYPGTEIYNDIEAEGLHHLNRSLKFTPHISCERFLQLTEEIDNIFSKYNLANRYRLIMKCPHYFLINIQQRKLLNVKDLLTLITSSMKSIINK